MKAFLLACALALAALPARADTVMSIVSASPSEWVGQGQSKTYTNANATFTVSGNNQRLQLRVVGTDGKTWDMVLKAPVGSTFRPHEYWYAEREGFEAGRAPSMDFSGNGRACGEVYGDFKLRQIGYDARGNVNMLEAAVLQRCEKEDAPPLAVTVMYRAAKLSFSLASSPEDWVGAGVNTTLYNDVATFEVNGNGQGAVILEVAGKGLDYTMMLVPPVGQARLAKGIYDTVRMPGSSLAAMDQFGNGRGDNESWGRLEVLSVTYDAADDVRQFSARYTFYKDATRTKVVRSGGVNFSK